MFRYAQCLCTKHSSALTTTIVGQMKMALSTYLGVSLFGTAISPFQVPVPSSSVHTHTQSHAHPALSRCPPAPVPLMGMFERIGEQFCVVRTVTRDHEAAHKSKQSQIDRVVRQALGLAVNTIGGCLFAWFKHVESRSESGTGALAHGQSTWSRMDASKKVQ